MSVCRCARLNARFCASEPLNRHLMRVARRTCIGHTTRAVASSGTLSNDELYDRDTEQKLWRSHFQSAPSVVTVVTGPCNSGKTRFVSHMAKEMQHEGVCLLNLRAVAVTTPEEFAKHIILALTGHAIDAGPNFTFKPTVTLGDIYDITLRLLWEWADARAQGKMTRYPCIIIDEANLMLLMAESHPAEFRTIMELFKFITKDKQLCHVVLVTSDYSFLDSLDTFIRPGYRFHAVVGDFPEQTAKQFVELRLNGCQHPWQETWEEDWPRLFKTFGGNVGDLLSAAIRYRTRGHWNYVTKQLAASISRTIDYQATNGGPGFSAAQYSTVALQLLKQADTLSHPQFRSVNPAVPV